MALICFYKSDVRRAPQDYIEAVRFYKLGAMYLNGDGVQRDTREL